MKERTQKFFSNNRNVIIVVIIFLLIVCPAIYTMTGIIKNAKEAASSYSTAVYFPAYPAPNMQGKNAKQIALINRGEYLVKAGDCIACHTNTAVKGPAFAGGLPMQTAFGTIYTPNITPDKETGLGTWSEDDFIKAMHDGISPSGTYYYPAFPYLYFNLVTYDDLKAIKFYLDNIPPVHQVNRENDMVWPFNWRFLQLGWRIMFFNPYNTGPYQTNPKESAQWNRGAYLVEGLGHCAMCHTPSHNIVSEQLSLGAPIRKYSLTGAVVQGYLAPNITKTNLGGIPDNELIQIFTEARLLGGGQVQGPMLEAVHDSLSHLTINDLLAIGIYLKTVESVMPPEPDIGTGVSGAYIYNSYCSGCHNIGVGGAPKFGDAASWGPLARSGMKKLYTVAIQGGGNMPAKGTCLHCSDLQIKQAVDYLVASALNSEQAQPQTQVLSKSTKLTSSQAQKIYDNNCSTCHSSGQKNVPQLGDQKAWKPIVGTGFLKAYQNIVAGRNGHPAHGGCVQCSDEELLAAVKYMLQKAAPNNNYILW